MTIDIDSLLTDFKDATADLAAHEATYGAVDESNGSDIGDYHETREAELSRSLDAAAAVIAAAGQGHLPSEWASAVPAPAIVLDEGLLPKLLAQTGLSFPPSSREWDEEWLTLLPDLLERLDWGQLIRVVGFGPQDDDSRSAVVKFVHIQPNRSSDVDGVMVFLELDDLDNIARIGHVDYFIEVEGMRKGPTFRTFGGTVQKRATAEGLIRGLIADINRHLDQIYRSRLWF